MIRLIPARPLCMLVYLLAAAAVTPPALAQTCGNPVSNALAESSVCDPFVRVTWTNPTGGLILPKVWRTAAPEFASATLVYNPGLGGATSFLDTPPTANVNYYYWVGGDIINCLGNFELRQIPLTGPLPAGRFTLTSFPAADTQTTCAGIRITWQPARDVTVWELVRVSSSNPNTLDSLGTFLRNVTSFTDTTAISGNQYQYAVFPSGGCGSAGSALSRGYLRAGTWTSAAAQGAAAPIRTSATLSVYNPTSAIEPISAPAPTAFTWSRNGTPLAESAKYSGTRTSTLTVNTLTLADAGMYTLTVQNGCQVFSVDPVLAVTQPCRADVNESGAVSVQDLFDFLTAYFSGCP